MNYLYNGIELPAPNWGEGKFVAIHKPASSSFLGYMLVVSEYPITTDKAEAGGWVHFESGKVHLARYTAVEGDEAWSLNAEVEQNGTSYGMHGGLVWANHDIYKYQDPNTLILAASDPISVGGEPIDPTSFMQGYIVGRRLAGMRK